MRVRAGTTDAAASCSSASRWRSSNRWKAVVTADAAEPEPRRRTPRRHDRRRRQGGRCGGRPCFTAGAGTLATVAVVSTADPEPLALGCPRGRRRRRRRGRAVARRRGQQRRPLQRADAAGHRHGTGATTHGLWRAEIRDSGCGARVSDAEHLLHCGDAAPCRGARAVAAVARGCLWRVTRNKLTQRVAREQLHALQQRVRLALTLSVVVAVRACRRRRLQQQRGQRCAGRGDSQRHWWGRRRWHQRQRCCIR